MEKSMRLVRELRAEFHQVLAMRPSQSRAVLVRANAVRLRTVVRAAQQRRVAGEVNSRRRGLQIRDTLVPSDSRLLHDVLPIEAAGV